MAHCRYRIGVPQNRCGTPDIFLLFLVLVLVYKQVVGIDQATE